jgi:hypothetical protein
MVKGFFSFLLMTLLVTSVGIGGIRPIKKAIMDEPTTSSPSPVQDKGDPGVQNGGLTWVLVDTMNNSYGMLTNQTDPLSYDPVSGYVGIVHRAKTSYGAGSGELWYNTSPDGATGWARISSLNGGAPIASRYPSATIASGAGAGSELFSFSAPQLNPGDFGYIIYGVDLLNAMAPFGVEDPLDNTAWSNTRITSADDSPYVWWAVSHNPNVANVDNAAIHLWRTMDYGTVDQFDIFDLSLFQTRGLEIGLAYRNGNLYAGAYATLVGDPNLVNNVFYGVSTDDGATWSAPAGPNAGTGDWTSLPGIAASAYDDWHIGGAWDMFVDNAGYVHFLGVIEDIDAAGSDRAVVEIFETAAGWDSKFVSEDVFASTRTVYGAIDQMGYHVGSAASPDGSEFSAVWLSAGAAGDTLPDIWWSRRNVADATWSTPVNLTATPDYAELLLHIAPKLRDDGGGMYTMFLARAYEQGLSSYPPNDVNATDIFTTTYSYSTTSVEPTSEFPSVYKLEQNYPNPFNPTTNIRYAIPNGSFVSLKVFDMLGQEVATLYNGYQDAGSYIANFDAASIANGTYYYTLTAGSFSETRKMIVLK